MSHFISSNKITLISFFLVVFTVIITLQIDKKEHQKVSTDQPQQSDQADYFMESYSIISVSESGQAYRWLSGKSLTHYPNNITELKKPTLQFSDKKSHWLLSANSGNIQKKEILIFDGNVKIHQLSGETNALNIYAEHLEISLADNIASTQSKVTVTNRDSEVSADGLKFDFNNRQLRLLSNVKGRYVFD